MAKVLSVEIGADVTRICLTDYRVKNPKVYKYAKIMTPAGVFVDGQIQVTEEFVGALKRVIAENKMNCKQVIFPITSSRIASREITIPLIKENKIESMIKTNASDYFPVDLTQYTIGHIILGKDAENSKYRVQVLAVPLNLLENYKQLAAACGMQMVAADYSGNSIYQMVKGECAEGVKMVVKVEKYASIVTIVKNGSITLQRTVAYGVDEEMPDAHREVLGSKGALINGVAKIIDYYSSRNKGELIDKIYITGIGADMNKLGMLFADELGIKTTELDSLEGYTLEQTFKDEGFGEYIACVGAVMAPIGFMPEKKEKIGERYSFGEVQSAGAYLILLGSILVGAVLIAVGAMNLRDEQKRYESDVKELNELAGIDAIYAEYLAESAVYEDIKSLYQTTENSNENLMSFIEELEEKMPANMRVTAFTSNATAVSMNIVVTTKEEMANAVQQFRTFDSLSDVSVSGAQDVIGEDGTRTVYFSVIGTYKTVEELNAKEATEVTADN